MVNEMDQERAVYCWLVIRDEPIPILYMSIPERIGPPFQIVADEGPVTFPLNSSNLGAFFWRGSQVSFPLLATEDNHADPEAINAVGCADATCSVPFVRIDPDTDPFLFPLYCGEGESSQQITLFLTDGSGGKSPPYNYAYACENIQTPIDSPCSICEVGPGRGR